MLSDLSAQRKVVGVKQTQKVIREGAAVCVYIAQDAENRVTHPVYELCIQTETPVQEVASMQELGSAVGIDVGAAVVAVLR